MKTKRFPRLHDDDTTPLEKKGTFLLESVGLEPTHDPPHVFEGIQRLYRLSYDSDTLFFQRILFNHSVDDTDDNKVDTIGLLGLQSIVERVDRLDGRCLHNHDPKTHLKSLARSVHGLWLSSTTRRNPHNSCLKWLGGTCHWSPHTSNVSPANLGTGRLARTCPWAKHNCRGFHTRFPRSTPLTNVVRVDRAGRCSQCTLGVGS